MKIGIVGGSLAGCSAAILLRKAGFEVRVFERSHQDLVGRGGGIGTTPTLLDEISADGLLDNGFSSIEISKMPFVGKSASNEPHGKTAWAMPINFRVFQWNELWKKLRSMVPNQVYQGGKKIVDAETTKNRKVALTSETGDRYYFDLVLFADGYNSFGRSLLFPEQKLRYRGYVLWRGMLPEAEMGNKSPLNDEILRLSYAGVPGHNVVYFIPNRDGSSQKGKRVFNWASYIAVEETALGSLMTDQQGKTWEGTLPPGALSSDNETQLKNFLAENIPEYYAEMVSKTRDSYLQVIYTLDLDCYYKDRMCLIGDAGIVVQPFTGSGVFKGYSNVKDLIESLKSHKTLEEALEKWSHRQLQTGKRLLALGEQMEKAFIWKPLDFATADKDRVKKWWSDSVTFPENFNYEKG